MLVFEDIHIDKTVNAKRLLGVIVGSATASLVRLSTRAASAAALFGLACCTQRACAV